MCYIPIELPSSVCSSLGLKEQLLVWILSLNIILTWVSSCSSELHHCVINCDSTDSLSVPCAAFCNTTLNRWTSPLLPGSLELRTPGGAKSFPRGAQIFWTVSNIFKLCTTHFFRGYEKFPRGTSPPLHPLWLRACSLVLVGFVPVVWIKMDLKIRLGFGKFVWRNLRSVERLAIQLIPAFESDNWLLPFSTVDIPVVMCKNTVELHHFVNASTEGYGNISYLCIVIL